MTTNLGPTIRCARCVGSGEVMVQYEEGSLLRDCAECFGTGELGYDPSWIESSEDGWADVDFDPSGVSYG